MNSMRNDREKEVSDFTRTQMKKDTILRELRKRGGRITKQREILLDIILEDTCSCCKEIHYKAVKQDPTIGIATVYRMINSLEEIGAISRKKCMKFSIRKNFRQKKNCVTGIGYFRKYCWMQEWNHRRQKKWPVC